MPNLTETVYLVLATAGLLCGGLIWMGNYLLERQRQLLKLTYEAKMQDALTNEHIEDLRKDIHRIDETIQCYRTWVERIEERCNYDHHVLTLLKPDAYRRDADHL